MEGGDPWGRGLWCVSPPQIGGGEKWGHVGGSKGRKGGWGARIDGYPPPQKEGGYTDTFEGGAHRHCGWVREGTERCTEIGGVGCVCESPGLQELCHGVRVPRCESATVCVCAMGGGCDRVCMCAPGCVYAMGCVCATVCVCPGVSVTWGGGGVTQCVCVSGCAYAMGCVCARV